MDRYDGFREFVLSRGPALSRTAFLLTGDHHVAEELLQSALTKTAVHWPRVLSGGNPEGYVRKAMVNERTSRWRKRARGTEHPTEAVPDLPGAVDSTRAADDRLSLAVALAKLAPKQRAVLVLRYYEDLTEAECADILGCAVGTVKRQTHDALARLRTIAPELAPTSAEAAL